MPRERVAEQISLHLRTSESLDDFALLLRLYALGCCHHVAVGGNADDGPDDGSRAGVFGDFLHEAAVDLDLVERETLQVLKRGIAGPKIVQRDVHAKLAELVQGKQPSVVVRYQYRLGDLQLQPARVEPGLGEHRGNLQGQG